MDCDRSLLIVVTLSGTISQKFIELITQNVVNIYVAFTWKIMRNPGDMVT